MAASASAARASTKAKANGAANQGRPVEEDKASVSDHVVAGTADAMAAVKRGLQSDEAKMMYLQFGNGVALGAGLTAGYLIVDAVFN